MYKFFLEGIQGSFYQLIHILLIIVALVMFLNGIKKLSKVNQKNESVYLLNERYALLMSEKGIDEENVRKRLKLRYKFQAIIGLIIVIGLILFKDKFYPIITPLSIIVGIIIIFSEKS